MPDNFGYIYDWMEEYDTTDPYADVEDQDALLWKTYQEVTAGLDPGQAITFEDFKGQHGYYIDTYNPAQEALLQEAFDVKVAQTEDLFTLKTGQQERDYALIQKYSAIDDSDDFESSTEMGIRHSKESEAIDKKLNRLNLISKGKNLAREKKITQDKALLKSIKSGQSDAVLEDLNDTFWDDMKVVRGQYDKQRLEKNQALNKLILQSEQTVASAFQSKEDSIQTMLTSAQGNMKNDAVNLLADISREKEEYSDELWDTLGALASKDAFQDPCANVICPKDAWGVEGTCVNGECVTNSEIAQTCLDQGGGYHGAGGTCYLPADAPDCADCDNVCHRQDHPADYSGDQLGQVVCGWEKLDYDEDSPDYHDPEVEENCFVDSDCGSYDQICNRGKCQIKGCAMLPGGCEGGPEAHDENYYCLTEGMDSSRCPESDSYVGDCAALGNCPDDSGECLEGGGVWTYVPAHSGYGLGTGYYCCQGGSEHSCGDVHEECPCAECDNDGLGIDCNGNECNCYPSPFN